MRSSLEAPLLVPCEFIPLKMFLAELQTFEILTPTAPTAHVASLLLWALRGKENA